MECTIRPARQEDSGEISAVILRALRETNAKDYTVEIIERVEHSFSPTAVLELIRKRTVLVAAVGSRVVGTASLDESVVRTVFVAPDVQALGIGKRLMAEIERIARERNIAFDRPIFSHRRILLRAARVQGRARQLLWR
ncbi:GNAT family N-acetyltransferase [Bradyrhizobium sp. 2]|uniref:GNAT family N-acetyltransferase n=1 Tax=Bradyrhizobium sp. 2 TaxID=190045 RepID=UPI001FF8F774|nr:GNAT family N-acetyltransferase [Bradyrhizobium sp. 2]